MSQIIPHHTKHLQIMTNDLSRIKMIVELYQQLKIEKDGGAFGRILAPFNFLAEPN
jgi:hypothetical protein